MKVLAKSSKRNEKELFLNKIKIINYPKFKVSDPKNL